MIRIHISPEWIFSIGCLLALPSVWGWCIAAQGSFSSGIALGIIGCAVSLALLIVGGRQLN